MTMAAQTITIAGQQLDRRALIGGGVAAGGYVLWRWWQHGRAAAENATPETAPALDPETWTTDNAPGGVAVRPPSGMTDSTGDAYTTPTTDAEWSQEVVEYMTTIGYDGPTVTTALGAFLAGQTLTAAQVAIVRSGLALFGRPPQHPDMPVREAPPAVTPAKPTPTPAKPAPKPAPRPTPPPAPHKTYRVVRGDTLSSIARKFHTTVSRLVAINHIKNPNRIYAGQTLTIG